MIFEKSATGINVVFDILLYILKETLKAEDLGTETCQKDTIHNDDG